MRTVVLYGNSLALSSLATVFETSPELRVIHLDPGEDNAGVLWRVRPDAIVLDLGLVAPDLREVCRLYPDVLLLGVDLASQVALVLTPRASRAVTTHDLLRVVEQCNAPGAMHPGASRTGCANRPDARRTPRVPRRGRRKEDPS